MTELPLKDILAQGGFALSLVVFVLMWIRSSLVHTADLRKYGDAGNNAMAKYEAAVTRLTSVIERQTETIRDLGERLRSTETQVQLAILTRANRSATPQPFPAQSPARPAPIPREEPEGRRR